MVELNDLFLWNTSNSKPLIYKNININAFHRSGFKRAREKKTTFQPVAQPADKENAFVDLYFKVKEESHAERITDQIINILTGEH